MRSLITLLLLSVPIHAQDYSALGISTKKYDALGGPCCEAKIPSVSYRNPVGHTHTCPSCKNTWDHQANSGHNCSECGTAQYVQDYYPKKVVPISISSSTTDENCSTSGGWGTRSTYRSGTNESRPILRLFR